MVMPLGLQTMQELGTKLVPLETEYIPSTESTTTTATLTTTATMN